MPELNTSFSTIVPTLQLAFDSTSLGVFKTCPRKYQLTIVEGWQPRGTSVHLTFGIHYHSALETYDHARFSGADHEQATLAAVRRAMEDTWDAGLNRPWVSDDKNKNRFTLVRSIVWYLDQFGASDNLHTVALANGRPAVELSFRMETSYRSSDGEPFLLCGHLDRVAELNGHAYVVDRKTSKHQLDERYFDQFSPHNQFTLYSLAAKIVYQVPVSGLICDGAQIAVTFSRFQRQPIPRTQEVLDEWYHDLGRWLALAEGYARDAYWPMNEMSCLVGTTIVTVTRGSRKSWKMPIRQLYSLFHAKNVGTRFNADLDTYLLSEANGLVLNQKVVDVIVSGTKPIFRMKNEHGESIGATADHRFKTEAGWKRLDEINVGDKVLIWDRTKVHSNIKKQHRAIISGLFYYSKGFSPRYYARSRLVGFSQRVSILTVEAALNNMSLREFILILRWNSAKAQTLVYLPKGVEVHHKNGKEDDDSLENLEPLTQEEHKKLHPSFAENVTRVSLAKIVSIEPAGEEEVFDIAMEGPHHNFIANSFVAHNCGNYGGCEFRPICRRHPSVREQWLRADYVKRVWDPLKTREI